MISVLHVDDDPAMVDLTATYLGRVRDDIEVRTATSGREALERVETERVDCIISDYDMPTMNGLELLEAVRDFDPELPFVLFTGKGSEEIASEAISAGVTDYLRKGTGAERYEILANRVANAVSQFDAERRARQHARVNDVLRQTIQSIVTAETRNAVLEAACRSLSSAGPYLFAACVEPDRESQTLTPVCWAGEDRGFLAAVKKIGIRMDDSPTGRGPGGRAARTGDVQVIENIREDPSFEPWREDAESRGFESMAAIPLTYRSSFHGVLGLFADRQNAFDEMERDVLTTLGTAIAHAVHTKELETES